MTVWRLHYRFQDGRREHVDVEGADPQWSWSATDKGRDRFRLERSAAVMRARRGDRGWWLDMWQPPSWRRRLSVWLHRHRRCAR